MVPALILNRKQLPSKDQMVESRVVFNSANELLVYDYIMPFKWSEEDTAVTPDTVVNFLKDAPKELTVRINSSGGDVGAALAIYNQLLEHGNVTTIVDGYAFSSAGWLALAGQNRQICNGGLFMMHNPYTIGQVNSLASVENLKQRWESHRDSIVDIFTSRTSLKADDVKNMMEAETYLGAQESVNKGLFHSVRNGRPETAILNCLELPEAARNKVELPRPDIEALNRRMLNIRRNFGSGS